MFLMQISCFDTNYRYNDEDEPSQFEDELALLDEIEMEMQDNFDDNDMPAGIISISNHILHFYTIHGKGGHNLLIILKGCRPFAWWVKCFPLKILKYFKSGFEGYRPNYLRIQHVVSTDLYVVYQT